MEVVFTEHVKRLATKESVEKQHSVVKPLCLSPEDIISQTQRIMENPDWQALMDDVINQMLNKSNTWSSLFENEDNALKNEVQEMGTTEPQPNVLVSNDQELGDDVGECLCSIVLNHPNVDVILVSRFMKGNRLAFMGLKQLEKEVNDYCFLHEPTATNDEVLVSFSEKHSLLRKDIVTLESFQMIDIKVVECWPLYVNEFARKSNQQPIAFCFGLSHSLRLKELLELHQSQEGTQIVHCLHTAWQEWLDYNNILWDYSKVEMFFVPYYHDEHFSLVVINIIAKTVQYLDNIHYIDPDSCYDIAEIVRGEFSTFLEAINHPKAGEVVEYAFEIVDFEWTVNENNDCGVYLMYFMERFDGSRTLTPLKESLKRRLFRASVCARLATCDMNNVRGQVLQKVAQLTQGKQDMRTDVEKQKKSKRQDLVAAPKKSRRVARM
ncbi:uncharacterized protein LOC141627329 [Silene latifolia]|uniref:uncharacterized protein LOC141627329 n=1 Tax=Silene latifolia TaxID=37657 RepID=UPI003D7870EA